MAAERHQHGPKQDSIEAVNNFGLLPGIDFGLGCRRRERFHRFVCPFCTSGAGFFKQISQLLLLRKLPCAGYLVITVFLD